MKPFNKKMLFVSKMISFFLGWLFLPIYIIGIIKRFKKCTVSDIEVKKILIIDLHLIGDIVMLTPLLSAIRNKYPQALITLIAGEWAKSILLNNPGLLNNYCEYNAPWVIKSNRKNSLFTLIKKIYLLRKEQFGLGVDVRGDFRNITILRLSLADRILGYDFTGGGWMLTDKIADNGKLKHIVYHHYKIARYLDDSVTNVDFLPALWLSDQEKKYVYSHSEFIALHLGASKKLRILSYTKASELIVSILKVSNKDLLLFCSPEIQDLIDNISILPEIKNNHRIKVFNGNLREFIVEVASASLYVGMDSSGAHIAAALNVPSIIIFGPAIPDTCRPLGSNIKIVLSEDNSLKCRPCDQQNCVNSVYQKCYEVLDFEMIITDLLKKEKYISSA